MVLLYAFLASYSKYWVSCAQTDFRNMLLKIIFTFIGKIDNLVPELNFKMDKDARSDLHL